MSKKLVSVLSFLLLLALASPGFCEIKPGTVYMSPFIGGYTFDGAQRLETNLAYGIRAGYNFTKNIGVEGVFDYVHTNVTQSSFLPPGDKSGVDAVTYGLDGLYHFMPESKLVPFVAAGFRGNYIDYPPGVANRRTGIFNYGGGAQYFVTDTFAFRGDVRHLVLLDRAQSNLEYTVGMSYFFDVTPKPVPPPPPCPEPVKVVAPPPPPPAAPTCILTVAPASITKGETASLNWTSENAKNCDIQPKIGAVNTMGRTTITPAADTAFTLTCTGPGGSAKSSANITVLPPPPPPEMLCYKIDIEFDFNKWDIKPQYHEELVKLANFMKDYPQLTGEIDGHTDSKGTPKYNMKLSQKRAESVRDYLVNKLGIDGSRLKAKGFGETQPIASNKTDEGRQKNRRVVANFACVEKKVEKKVDKKKKK